MSDMFSHQAWRLLSGAYERVLLQPSDFEARVAMLVGAHLAGMAIEQSMLGAAHACANPLTARYASPTAWRSRSCCRTSSAGTPRWRAIATRCCSARRGGGWATGTAQTR